MAKTSLPMLVVATVTLACVHAGAADKKTKEDPMSATKALADFLGTLEKAMPLDETKLGALLGATFKAEKDANKRRVLVATKLAPGPQAVALAGVRFYPATKDGAGELQLQLATSAVDELALGKLYPAASWRPPPPPGWAPEGAGPACIVDRPWGEIWFTFRYGTVVNVSFAFGQHSGSGV
jgi:hypothetical protein